MNNYVEQSDTELIAALECAGRIPQPALIDEILTRRNTMAAPLVALFADSLDDHWENSSDLRWYRGIHAGRILLYWREPTAIPPFATLYQSGDGVIEWFEDSIARFGPPAIPAFRDVLLTDTGKEWHYGKAFITDVLAYIALQHPESRDDVLAALYSVLPTLHDDGSLVIPADQSVDENWSPAVYALAILQDNASQSLILAMYNADVIDTSMLTRTHYQQILKKGSDIPSRARYFDLPSEVRKDWEREQTRLRRSAREASRPQARRAPVLADQPKISRNAPCPCDSGRKYKHCCGKR